MATDQERADLLMTEFLRLYRHWLEDNGDPDCRFCQLAAVILGGDDPGPEYFLGTTYDEDYKQGLWKAALGKANLKVLKALEAHPWPDPRAADRDRRHQALRRMYGH